MAENSLSDLQYGHVGQPVYDVDLKRWRFGRTPGQNQPLNLICPGEILIQPSASRTIENELDQSYRSLDRRTQRLLQAYPELVPAAEVITEYARASSAANLPGPDTAVQGALLALSAGLGAENDQDASWFDVAALSGGENGASVQLLPVREEHRRLSNDQNAWLRVPALKEEDATWWAGDGTPVQQISFTKTANDDDRLMIIRSLKSTTILRLSCRLRHSEASKPRIVPTVLSSVSFSATGKVAHVDAALNPWHPDQFAVIDRLANWKIFQIRKSQGSTKLVKASILRSGTIFAGETEHESERTPTSYGWGRIMWAGNTHIVIACTRLPSFSVNEESNFILDVQALPGFDEFFLLLTSLHIFCVRLVLKVTDNREDLMKAQIMQSWEHFRDPADTTLFLSTIRDDEDAVRVLLASRRNSLILSFRLQFSAGKLTLPVQFMDPTAVFLDLPRAEHGRATPKMRSLTLRPVAYGHGADQQRKRMESHSKFLVMIILFDDYSVSSFLGCTFDANSYALHGRGNVPSVTSPMQSSVGLSTSVKSDSVIAPGTISDFEDESAGKIIGSRRARPQGTKRARNTIPIKEAQVDFQEEYWTRHDESIYDKITEQLNDEEDFLAALGDLRGRLGALPENVRVANQTLFELCAKDLRVRDIDEAAEALKQVIEWTRSSHNEGQAKSPWRLRDSSAILPVLLPPFFEYDHTSPSVVYDKLISYWLAPLPEEVPAKLRLAKEKLARKIAVEVCLANVSAEVEESPANDSDLIASQGAGSVKTTTMSFALPVRQSSEVDTALGSRNVLRSLRPDSDRAPNSSMSLPQSSGQNTEVALPTPELTPSLKSSSSVSSRLTDLTEAKHDLNRYGVFPQAALLTRPLERCLSHWTAGADPAHYDWESTSRNLQNRNGEGDEMSASQHRRLKRRTERLLKRQRREAQIRPDETVPATDVRPQPHPAWRSSPALAERQVSSQVAPSQPVLASQLERGRHGGRPPVNAQAANKKKRKAGF